ncbi:Gem-associated protein 5 [Chionoecetes opilio]|uniref:Gem-associated protein 5 n=1 Tax=Chionoecetes opilio TaxID=41210 RepID=A0A8J4YGU4_CHIOP|nr:Gem-associated protein 5 [Chionoecetes opilio]
MELLSMEAESNVVECFWGRREFSSFGPLPDCHCDFDFDGWTEHEAGDILLPPSPNWFVINAVQCRAEDRLLIIPNNNEKTLCLSICPRASHPDFGHTAACVCEGGVVRLFNLHTGEVVGEHSHHEKLSVNDVCWGTVDDELVVVTVGGGGRVVVWQPQHSVYQVHTLPQASELTVVEVNPKDRSQALVAATKDIALVNLKSWRQSSRSDSQGPFFASSDHGRNIYLWDVSAKRYVTKMNVPVSSGGYKRHTMQNKDKGKPHQHIPLAWYKKGLLSSTVQGELLHWTALRGKWAYKALHHLHSRAIYNLLVMGDCVVTSGQDRMLHGYDAASLTHLFQLPTLGSFTTTLAFCPQDATRLAIGLMENAIRILKFDSPTPLQSLTVTHTIKGKILSLAWHPEKEGRLLFGTATGQVGWVDASGQVTSFAYFHQKSTYKVEWAPPVCPQTSGIEEPWCAYSFGDREIMMRSPSRPMNAHQPEDLVPDPEKKKFPKDITEFSFSPDYTLLAVGLNDGQVLVYRREDLEHVATVVVVKKSVQHLLWRPEAGPNHSDNHSETEPNHSETEPNHSETGPNHSETGPNHSVTGPNHSVTGPNHSETGPNHSETEPNHSEAEPNHSETEPSHSETEPNHSEAEPNHSETAPNHSETEPSHSETEPNHSETGPKHSETEPSHSETEPNHSETGPKHSETEPSHSETEPSHSETEPNHSETEPNHSETGPSHSETGPNHSETEPNYSETEPNHSETEPNHSETKPNPSETALNHSETAPNHSETGPNHSETAPNHSETGLNHSETGPNHSETAPNHSETAPNHSETAPNHSETAPNHSKTGPNHSETEPKHSKTGPNHSETEPKHSETGPNHSETGPKHSETGPNQSETELNHSETRPNHSETGPNHSHIYTLAVGSNENKVYIFCLDRVIKGLKARGPEDSEGAEVLVTQATRTLHGHEARVVWLSWSPHNPAILASASYDNTVQLWDTDNGTMLGNYGGHCARVFRVEFSLCDADLLYSCAEENLLHCWRPSQLSCKTPAQSNAVLKDYRPKFKKGQQGSGSAEDTPASQTSKEKQPLEEKEKGDVPPPSTTKISTLTDGTKKSASDGWKKPVFKSFFPKLHATSSRKKGFHHLVLLSLLAVNEAKRDSNTPPKATGIEDSLEDDLEDVEGSTQEEEGQEIDALPIVVSTREKYGFLGDKDCNMASAEDFVYMMQMYGEPHQVNDLLASEIEVHESRGTPDQANLMHCWHGSLGTHIRAAARQKKLTPFLVASAPQVSMKLWETACEAYAEQLLVEGDAVTAASYLLNIHKVEEAIDVLVQRKYYREAMAIVKSRLGYQGQEQVDTVASSWVTSAIYEGNMDLAATLQVSTGQVEAAARTLSRRTDPGSLFVAAKVYETAGNADLAACTGLAALREASVRQELEKVEAFLCHLPEVSWFGVLASVHSVLLKVITQEDTGCFSYFIDAHGSGEAAAAAASAGGGSSCLLEEVKRQWDAFTPDHYEDLYQHIHTHFSTQQSPSSVKQLWFLVAVSLCECLLAPTNQLWDQHLTAALRHAVTWGKADQLLHLTHALLPRGKEDMQGLSNTTPEPGTDTAAPPSLQLLWQLYQQAEVALLHAHLTDEHCLAKFQEAKLVIDKGLEVLSLEKAEISDPVCPASPASPAMTAGHDSPLCVAREEGDKAAFRFPRSLEGLKTSLFYYLENIDPEPGTLPDQLGVAPSGLASPCALLQEIMTLLIENNIFDSADFCSISFQGNVMARPSA